MNTIGEYFVKKNGDGISAKENIISGKNYRFTVLTDRLIRLEYSPNGVFEDRLSQRVIYRKFPKVSFNFNQSDMLIQLITSYFTLDYVKDKSFSSGKLTPGSNLKITLNNTDRIWYYNHPEARNFGGITYSLDNFSGNLKLEKGLYSTDGFAVLDDSDSLVLDEHGNFIVRENKELDLYIFMYKKDFGLCLQDYYTLTGYPMMIPRYALGNWWYKNHRYSTEELEQLLLKFKENKIPISTILLGDKWHLNNDPFIFDEQYLNIKGLRQLLNHYNMNLGLTVTPSMPAKADSPTYENLATTIQGLDTKEYSFLPLDNQKLNLFSNYGFRNWLNLGVDAFYIDYNNIKDKKVLALLDHYSYAMTESLLNKRGLILSRNHAYSIHRNQVIYNGNTKVDWETLAVLPRYLSTASNNGISFIANAIGGYYGGIENFELYNRYIQLGVFSPILMIASDEGKYYRREPWRWNAAQFEMLRKYLTLRNQLIPYIYTESYIYYQSGSPLIQPLYYQYPKIYDEPLYKNQYFFGSQMLVCPITKKKNTVMNRVVQRMFIPEGVWYELESGKKYLGNKYYMSFYKDEDYPVFCKEGSIIPLSLDEGTNLPTNMEIIIFPGSDGTYKLYEDDGITTNYKGNAFSLTEFLFHYQMNSYELIIKSTSNSGVVPQNRNYRIRFKNTKMANINIQSDQMVLTGNTYLEKNDLIIEVTNIPTSRELKVQCYSEGVIENSTIRLINDDIKGIIEDLEIETTLKEKIDAILFGDLPVKKKRIAVRKLKKAKLEPKFIKMFLNLLEYIQTV